MVAPAINYKHTLDSHVESYRLTILLGELLPSSNYRRGHLRHRVRFSKAERTNSRKLSGQISYSLCVAQGYLGRQQAKIKSSAPPKEEGVLPQLSWE